MNLDDFAGELSAAENELSGAENSRCEICVKLGVGNCECPDTIAMPFIHLEGCQALEDLGDCPICYRYTRLNTNGTCGREYCSRLWKRAKRLARS